MANTEEEVELIEIDESKDMLIAPMKVFLAASFKIKLAKENLFSMLYVVGIITAAIYIESRPYVYSVMELSLPDELKLINNIFRLNFMARKSDLDKLSPKDKNDVLNARIVRASTIVPFLRDMYNTMLAMYPVVIVPSPVIVPNPVIVPSPLKVKPPTPSKKKVNLVDEIPPEIVPSTDVATLDDLNLQTGEKFAAPASESLGPVGGSKDLQDAKDDSLIIPPTHGYFNGGNPSKGLKKGSSGVYDTSVDAVVSIALVLASFLYDKNILDPACGNGNIVNALKTQGFSGNIIGTDIIGTNSLDYLTDELPTHDVIFTNPPFELGLQFLEKAYKDGKPFIMLLPTTNIGNTKMYKLFKNYGVIMYCIFPRPTFLHDNLTGKPQFFCEIRVFL